MSISSMKNFKGKAEKLGALDVPMLADRILVSEDHLGAFLDVEARAKGFDSQGRPVMLFEPHVFYRNLHDPAERKRAVDLGLAYPKWGTKAYPKDSYPRLLDAMKINEDAALVSCSIGMSQILVENFASVGYQTPQQMWLAFMDDEKTHVEAMVKFILVNNIDDDIRAERWSVAARVYNGPGYAKNKYDVKMAEAFAKRKKLLDQDFTPTPVLDKLTVGDATTVKSVQNKLAYLGYYEVGKQDGVWGTKTRAAVLGFRADHGLPLVADIDNDLLSALMLATPRPVSEERATATASDLKDMGVTNVAAVGKAESAGYVTVAGGAAAAITSLAEKTDDLKAFVGKFSGIIDAVKELSPWLIVGVGAYIVYHQWKAKKAAVEDYRTGRYVG